MIKFWKNKRLLDLAGIDSYDTAENRSCLRRNVRAQILITSDSSPPNALLGCLNFDSFSNEQIWTVLAGVLIGKRRK